MWARSSIGQQWQKNKAKGNADKLDFYQAQEAAADFILAGFNDWRVPTLDELKTLIRERKRVGYDCPKGALFRPLEGESW